MSEHPYKIDDRVLTTYAGRLVRAKVVGCYVGTGGDFMVDVRPETWTVYALYRNASEVQPIDAVSELAKIGRFLPTKEDIGRGVVYTPYPGATSEDGAITSVTDRFVFVRYQDQHPSAPGKATNYKDLRWLSG